MAVAATVDIQLNLGGVWTSVWSSWQTSLHCEYGIMGASPNDRVASAGKLTGDVDNGRSGVTPGLYSLLHASKLANFDLNIGVRLVVSCSSVAAGTLYYKWRGTLHEALPDAGQYGEKLTHLTAFDIFDDFARIEEPDIPLQENKRIDEIITTLFAAMTTVPTTSVLEVGVDTFRYALDGGAGQKMKIRERLNQLCLSEWGYAYPIGDTTGGGSVRVENRQHRSANPTVQFHVNGTMEAITVPASRDDVFRTEQVIIHTAKADTDNPTTVLFELTTTETTLAPGETNSTLFGPYTDPVSNDQVGGQDMFNPVAVTDYTMNTLSDDSGLDMTSLCSVTAVFTGSGVRFSITNGSTETICVTKLQVRGTPVRRSDIIIEKTIAGSYGDQVETVDMPFQSSLNVGDDVCTYLALVRSSPFAAAKSVRFFANRDAAHMTAALQLEPGDRIAITEPQTGLDADEFTINGVVLDFVPGSGGLFYCTWMLEAAGMQRFWLLGTAGASEIGSTTWLGF